MPANTLDKKYLDLVEDILNNGIQKSSRAGDTISVFGRTIRHDMKEGFPILTTKKMHWKSIVTELLWFLNGETNIKFLLDRDCHIWDGDAYKNYLTHQHDIVQGKHEIYGDWYGAPEFIEKIKTDPEFAKKWGDLGPIYGKQWRSWYSYDFIDDEVHKIKDPVTKFIHTIGMQVRRCIICGKKQQRINGKVYRWATHISQR